MGDQSGIEWTHVHRPDGTVYRGATWNIVTGCHKISSGCKHCYAEREWQRFSKAAGTRYFKRDFTDVQCHDDLLDVPLRWSAPRGIFVNPRGDLFHESVPFAFVDQVFDRMRRANWHIFQILTKRPQRMLEYFKSRDIDGWPFGHVWLGVSVEDQDTADERIPLLLQIPAAVRWISAEPLLGPMDIRCWLKMNTVISSASDLRYLNWVVAGGESGTKARPSNPVWVRSLRDQCNEAGVPFNFKQWGEWSPERPVGYCRLTKNTWSHDMYAWDNQGHVYNPVDPAPGHFPSVCMWRVGKRKAGRMLDGKILNGFPGVISQ